MIDSRLHSHPATSPVEVGHLRTLLLGSPRAQLWWGGGSGETVDLESKELGSEFYSMALTGSLSITQFSQMENGDVIPYEIAVESKGT